MDKKQIKELAEAHATKVLGIEEYCKNKDAALSVMSDFKAGFKACMKANERSYTEEEFMQEMSLYAEQNKIDLESISEGWLSHLISTHSAIVFSNHTIFKEYIKKMIDIGISDHKVNAATA